MAISAWRNKKGGAYRLWVLAKAIDQKGSGFVLLDDLRFQADKLGVHPKSFGRWLRAALNLGLMRQVRGGAKLVLPSHEKGAYVLGCNYAGSRRAVLPIRALFGKGWRAYVWAAYEATHNGRPITRAKLQELTGVPASTQRALEREAALQAEPQYMVTNTKEFFLAEWVEEKPHAFSFDDRGRRMVAWRGPNAYETDGIAENGKKGRSKKINKALKHFRGLSYRGQASTVDDSEAEIYLRLYNETPRQTRATLNKMAKYDVPVWKVSEIFEHKHSGLNANFWRVLSTYEALSV